MSKMEFLDALEAEKFKKQKCIQFCWTPCITHLEKNLQNFCYAQFKLLDYYQPYPWDSRMVGVVMAISDLCIVWIGVGDPGT